MFLEAERITVQLSSYELHKADSGNSHTCRYALEGGGMAQEVERGFA